MKGLRCPGGYGLHEHLSALCGTSGCILDHVAGMFLKTVLQKSISDLCSFFEGMCVATFIFEK